MPLKESDSSGELEKYLKNIILDDGTSENGKYYTLSLTVPTIFILISIVK